MLLVRHAEANPAFPRAAAARPPPPESQPVPAEQQLAAGSSPKASGPELSAQICPSPALRVRRCSVGVGARRAARRLKPKPRMMGLEARGREQGRVGEICPASAAGAGERGQRNGPRAADLIVIIEGASRAHGRRRPQTSTQARPARGHLPRELGAHGAARARREGYRDPRWGAEKPLRTGLGSLGLGPPRSRGVRPPPAVWRACVA